MTAILSLIVFGAHFGNSKKTNNALFAYPLCKICVLIFLGTIFLTFSSKSASSILFGGNFICDVLSQNTKLIVLSTAILSILIGISHISAVKINGFEFFCLLLFSILGLLFLCSSFDFVSIYLAIEVQSLCFYVLATFYRQSAYSTEAGLKYVFLGAFSSGILLFGISIIYGFTGTTNFEDLHLILSLEAENFGAIQLGILFVSCAFLFKISVAPFHVWAPDVYEGSPFVVVIFFTLVPKMALMATFLRILYFCFGLFFFFWEHLLLYCSVVSIILGSFLALKQRKLKRLFAYSSIGHAGYILIAVCSCGLEGLQACFIYLIAYAVISSGTWAFVSCLQNRYFFGRTRTFADLVAMGRYNFLLALSGSAFLFSITGIPPFVGFYSKFCVFQGSIQASLYLYSLLIIFVSVLSAFYNLRLVKIAFFEAAVPPLYKSISKELSFILGFSCFLNFFLFVNPHMLRLFSLEMALSLL